MNTIKAPPFSNRYIIEAAENLVREHALEYCGTMDNVLRYYCTTFDVIFENYIYPRYEINLIEDEDLGFAHDGSKNLGVTFPKKNTVYIDRCLHYSQRDRRRTFTLWHEVGGHAILQGPWLRGQLEPHDSATSLLVTTERELDADTVILLERQANLFASHAAAPSWLLHHVMEQSFRLTRAVRFIGPGEYSFVTNGRTHNEFCPTAWHAAYCLARLLPNRFGDLSYEALSYRILNAGYVNDCTARSDMALYRQVNSRTATRQFLYGRMGHYQHAGTILSNMRGMVG